MGTSDRRREGAIVTVLPSAALLQDGIGRSIGWSSLGLRVPARGFSMFHYECSGFGFVRVLKWFTWALT